MNLSKKSKWLIAIFLIGFISVYAAYKYAYKPHKTIESLATDFNGSSNDFLLKIKKDPSIWSNKTVKLTGIISSKDNKGFTLSNSIYCQLRENINNTLFSEKQNITIKGRVIGYDDLLEELKLDQCIIQE